MKDIERYLEFLDELVGAQPDAAHFARIDPDGTTPPVTVISYGDVPEPGYRISFSYGLSSLPNDEWRFSSPELVICVNSTDDSWGLAIGEAIVRLRGKSSFAYGTIIGFGEAIGDHSMMDRLLVCPTLLLAPDQATVKLSDRQIGLSQAYPIHAEEASLIGRIGVEEFFWHSDIDFYDIRRPPTRRS